MARVYIRRKIPGQGWRYKAVPKGAGRRPTIEPGANFHVRYPDASGRFVWSLGYDSFEEAQKEAAGLELNAKAVQLGLNVEEYKNRANSQRTTIKSAIDDFLSDARKTKKKKTAVGYEHNLKQFQDSAKVRFMDEITKKTLTDFRDFLAGKGYEARTQHNRLMTVLSLLKKNKIRTEFSLTSDLPEFEEEPAVPYEPAELKKLGSAQEFDETRILGRFLQNDKFCFCDRHALGFEQQVGEILVAAASSKKSFDVAVDGFHHPEGYLGAAVVEDAVQVIQQHEPQLLEGRQALPSQLIDPALQVTQHRSFIVIRP